MQNVKEEMRIEAEKLAQKIRERFKDDLSWRELGMNVEVHVDDHEWSVVVYPCPLLEEVVGISEAVIGYVTEDCTTRFAPAERWFDIIMASYAIMECVKTHPSIKPCLRRAIEARMDNARSEPPVPEIDQYTEEQWNRLLTYCERIFRNFVVEDWPGTIGTIIPEFTKVLYPHSNDDK